MWSGKSVWPPLVSHSKVDYCSLALFDSHELQTNGRRDVEALAGLG
jgi:hypothetical protein